VGPILYASRFKKFMMEIVFPGQDQSATLIDEDEQKAQDRANQVIRDSANAKQGVESISQFLVGVYVAMLKIEPFAGQLVLHRTGSTVAFSVGKVDNSGAMQLAEGIDVPDELEQQAVLAFADAKINLGADWVGNAIVLDMVEEDMCNVTFANPDGGVTLQLPREAAMNVLEEVTEGERLKAEAASQAAREARAQAAEARQKQVVRMQAASAHSSREAQSIPNILEFLVGVYLLLKKEGNFTGELVLEKKGFDVVFNVGSVNDAGVLSLGADIDVPEELLTQVLRALMDAKQHLGADWEGSVVIVDTQEEDSSNVVFVNPSGKLVNVVLGPVPWEAAANVVEDVKDIAKREAAELAEKQKVAQDREAKARQNSERAALEQEVASIVQWLMGFYVTLCKEGGVQGDLSLIKSDSSFRINMGTARQGTFIEGDDVDLPADLCEEVKDMMARMSSLLGDTWEGVAVLINRVQGEPASNVIFVNSDPKSGESVTFGPIPWSR
jgi:hypothetical protein